MPNTTLVSRDDAVRIARKLLRTGAAQSLRWSLRSVVDPGHQVVEHWNTPGVDSQWWDIPAVQFRWSQMLTGSDLDFRGYVAATYFDGPLRALSLGCGFGGREIAWAKLDVFQELVGVDIAPQAVEQATAAARAAGIPQDRLRFETVDSHLRARPGDYDVVIFEHSLHHFSDVRGTLADVERLLRPGGLLVLDEYVGPSKFQWTTRQVEAADALLRLMPTLYRRRPNAPARTAVRRPSLLAMRIDDPSEAVDAASILPAVHERFEVVEERGYGGALLHPLFSGIAHNFCGDDEVTRSLLQVCFQTEDALLAAGEIQHDFATVVARRR